MSKIRNIIVILVIFLLFIITIFFLNRISNSPSPVFYEISRNERLLTGYSVEKIWDLKLPNYLRAFAIDSKDNMYISQAYEGLGTNSRILKYNKDGILLGWFGKGEKNTGWHGPNLNEKSFAGAGDGEFYYIFKIAFDKDDTMYVIDRSYYDSDKKLVSVNERIQKFDKEGGYLGSFGGGILQEPTCLLLYGNDLLVTSWSLHKIDKFDLISGVHKEWLGKSNDGSYGWHMPDKKSVEAPFFGQEIGAFNNPFDCKIDSKEKLYVLSYNSDPVIGIFDYKSGKYIDGLFHSQGYKPQNIILDKYDNLIMSDNYEGSIRFLNRNKQEVAKLQLGPGGDYFAVGDFAFDSDGYLFFLEKMKGKIYKIKLNY